MSKPSDTRLLCTAIDTLRRFAECPRVALFDHDEEWPECLNPDGEELCTGVQQYNCWYAYITQEAQE